MSAGRHRRDGGLVDRRVRVAALVLCGLFLGAGFTLSAHLGSSGVGGGGRFAVVLAAALVLGAAVGVTTHAATVRGAR